MAVKGGILTEDFAQWFKERREALGYSQVEVAEIIGVDEDTVSAWENPERSGGRLPGKTRTRRAIRNLFGDHPALGLQPNHLSISPPGLRSPLPPGLTTLPYKEGLDVAGLAVMVDALALLISQLQQEVAELRARVDETARAGTPH